MLYFIAQQNNEVSIRKVCNLIRGTPTKHRISFSTLPPLLSPNPHNSSLCKESKDIIHIRYPRRSLHASFFMTSSPSIHLVTHHVDAVGEFQAPIHHVDPPFLNLQSESSQESSTDHRTSSNTVSSIGGSSSGSGGGGACNGATGCRGHTADDR